MTCERILALLNGAGVVISKRQVVRLGTDKSARRIVFAEGETIHTENSYKFTVARFAALAEKAGWTLEASWMSKDPAFAVVSLMA